MVDRTTKKLYRQKGTGRARHGARGAPIFVGGGIAHGPHPRSYAYRLPKKVRHLAMRSALSVKAAEGRIAVIVQLDLERPKTGPLAKLLRAVGGDVRQRSESHRTESVLLVTAAPHQVTERSAANLRGVRVAPAASLNVHDVLRADLLMFTREALEKVTEALSA
jgi:large subunit ribosomal protein L4